MGRGRQKAKQTKVARDLKYRAVDTDFASLARELRGSEDAVFDAGRTAGLAADDDYDEIPEEWADLAAKYLAPADESDD